MILFRAQVCKKTGLKYRIYLLNKQAVRLLPLINNFLR